MNKLEDHNYNAISATIIADSLSPLGTRLTTFLVTFPRIVLAEFNTHRQLSRNSASSRAIPFDKMVKRIKENPFIPIRFQKDHKGMQGSDYLQGRDKELAAGRWLAARDAAVQEATYLNKNIGATKQLANRLLEPFLWHTAIVTASEWENFFSLRAHDAAEIHIAKLAEMMLEQYNYSEPCPMEAGQWHIPFSDNIDMERVDEVIRYVDAARGDLLTQEQVGIKIATARCARVSYLNYEGGDDYDKDIILHDRLSSPTYGHWSPFEHPAQAMTMKQFFDHVRIYRVMEIDKRIAKEIEHGVTKAHPVAGGGFQIEEYGWSGNFRGFIQYRKMFRDENRIDQRVKSKIDVM